MNYFHVQEGHSVSPSTLTELDLPLILQWRQGNDMPLGTSSSSLVIIDNHLYVGGGRTISTKREQMIMVYNLHSQQWNELSRYECTSFGMAELKNQLVVVGGIAVSTNKTMNVLGLWDKDKELWTHPFPPMSIARHSPSVIARHHMLVVAGGYSLAHGHLSSVEILDSFMDQWHTAMSLPFGCSCASSAVNGNMWYLMGANCDRDCAGTEVFGVCLDDIISAAISHTQFRSPPWKTLPNTPLVQCSALSMKGALLAIGGCQESRSLRSESTIYLFQPCKQQWTIVGNLPIQRSNCRCTVLPSGEVLVVGGLMNAQRLNIATLTT